MATRLLQRYGYLLPTPNPDSDLAKQQDLIMKERVKRFVALEAEQDSQLLHPEKKTEEAKATVACDPQRDDDCEQLPPNLTANRTMQVEPQIPESSPSLPVLPSDISPYMTQPRTMRTSLRGGDETDLSDRSMSGSGIGIEYDNRRVECWGWEAWEKAVSGLVQVLPPLRT